MNDWERQKTIAVIDSMRKEKKVFTHFISDIKANDDSRFISDGCSSIRQWELRWLSPSCHFSYLMSYRGRRSNEVFRVNVSPNWFWELWKYHDEVDILHEMGSLLERIMLSKYFTVDGSYIKWGLILSFEVECLFHASHLIVELTHIPVDPLADIPRIVNGYSNVRSQRRGLQKLIHRKFEMIKSFYEWLSDTNNAIDQTL